MKHNIVFAVLAAACATAAASEFAGTLQLQSLGLEVRRMPFGSGAPATDIVDGDDHADHVADGMYHVPNYMPGFPTAATIWPREIAVECDAGADGFPPACSGYRVLPSIGRGEYIFIRPVMKPAPKTIPPAPPPVLAPERFPLTRKKPLG